MTRKALHAAVAVVAVPALLLVPIWIAVGLAAAGVVVVLSTWLVDTRGRRHDVPAPMQPFHEAVEFALEKTMRHDEPFPWSAMYYIGGLILLALSSDVLGVPLSIAFAAYAVLGVGDAASALVGLRFGRHRIPWNTRKSWEGTLAGIVLGAPAALLMAGTYYWITGDALPGPLVPIIVGGAVAGMLVESLPVEDNFGIPVSAWLVMTGLAWGFGVA